MKPKESKVKYEAWLSAEDMHNNSQKWLSELEFVKDEQLFFDDLIKSYTLQLVDSRHFTESKKVIDKLSILQKETDSLISKVKNHERGLKVMVDGINEFEKEHAYKVKHGVLTNVISTHIEKYRKLKTQLFLLVTGIIKESKQKRLLQ